MSNCVRKQNLKSETAEYFREKNGKLYPCGSKDRGAKKMRIYDPDFPQDNLNTDLSITDFSEVIGKIIPVTPEGDYEKYNDWDDEFGSGVSAIKVNLN